MEPNEATLVDETIETTTTPDALINGDGAIVHRPTVGTFDPPAPLDDCERATLAECESAIRKGVAGAFVAVGTALQTIRDNRLYRESHPDDFESYCREKWSISRQRAHQLIASVPYVNAIVDAGLAAPATEGAVRLFVGRPVDVAVGAWQSALESAGPGRKAQSGHVKAALAVIDGTTPPTPKPPTADAVLTRFRRAVAKALADLQAAGMAPDAARDALAAEIPDDD